MLSELNIFETEQVEDDDYIKLLLKACKVLDIDPNISNMENLPDLVE